MIRYLADNSLRAMRCAMEAKETARQVRLELALTCIVMATSLCIIASRIH